MILDYFAAKEGVAPEDKIVLVQSTTLVAMHLAVFIKRKYVPYISNITTEALPLGFKGNLGNKGAHSISFSLGGIRLLFINCHLEAHEQKFIERN
jgi:hypothetical protein